MVVKKYYNKFFKNNMCLIYIMSKLLNSLLFLGAILAIALVLSGYKESFELNDRF